MKRLIVGLLVVLGVGQAAECGVIVVNDEFTDGGRTDGTDPLDISWYKSRADMELTVAGDSVIGDGNALLVDTVSVAGSPTVNYIVGAFNPVNLGANIGDKISFSYDFHFTGTVPVDTGANFRFGVFSSEGTTVTSDATAYTEGQDDLGYGFAFEASSSLVAPYTKRWLGADIGGPDGKNLPTTTTGSPGDLSDTSTKHTATITVQRLTDTSNLIGLEIGDLQTTAIDSALDRFETFDEIVIRGSYKQHLDFAVDNVRVEVQSIPEPSTLAILGGFLGMGLIGHAWRHRHRREVRTA